MKNGTYLSSSTPYGYELKDGEYHIIEKEADIVRLIFKSYLLGMGKKAISDMLNQMDAPKRLGHAVWRINTVGYILGNERYRFKKRSLLWFLYHSFERLDIH